MTKHHCLEDPIVAEIHEYKKSLIEMFEGNIHAITEAAKKRQEQSGRTTVSYATTPPSPKPTEPSPSQER